MDVIVERTCVVLLCFMVTVTCLPTRTSGHTDDIILDIDELSKLGDTDKILEAIRKLAGSLHGCGVKGVPNLSRVNLTRSVSCNDGSLAGYYIRKSFGSTKWIIHLEGGGYCFDGATCHSRWINMQNVERNLMSSRKWQETRIGTGILSWDPEENPSFFTANVVLVPYCSSDAWSGTAKARSEREFSFMGSQILAEVVKDLLANQGMHKGKKLLLTGSSAGGLGVLLNVDKVAAQVKKVVSTMDVRGIADSGWFMDNKQYRDGDCSDARTCAPTEGIQRGMQLWKANIPEGCRKQYPNEEWKCFFGYRLYPFIKAPVFIVQFLFDEAQIAAENVGTPLKKEQWQYIHNMGKSIKQSLQNVSAVFASACLSHTTLTLPDWHKMTIKGVTLTDALKCWTTSDHEPNSYYPSTLIPSIRSNENKLLGDEAVPRVKKNKNKKKKGRKSKKKKKGNKRRRKERRERRRNRKRIRSERRGTKNSQSNELPRRERSAFIEYINPGIEEHRLLYHPTCRHHLADTCEWPQCNQSCPKLRNPFSGEEIDFIDLLMQFGLDMSSIAEALGKDLKTLQTMDHAKLIKLLMEQE